MTNKIRKHEGSVLSAPNIKIGLNFGFMGLGMGGTSIAAACADIQTKVENERYPYTALLINTNKIDLEKVNYSNHNTKKVLIGDGRGAGRNIEIGEDVFIKHSDKVIQEANRLFADKDFVWVVAGLGGGTGTGSIIQAIKLLVQNGFNKKIGLILTLPRTSEGTTVLRNALTRLAFINKAMKGLGSIIIVDNQKLYNHFAQNSPSSTVAEYLTYSNEFIAETLHELNVVTSSFTPAGENHFDSSEFENLIKTSGVLHLSRFVSKAREIDTSLALTHSGKLKANIEEGVLSDGYNLSQSTRLAVSILANKATAARLFNFEFDKSMEEEIEKIAPFANEKPIAQYIYDQEKTSDVYFFAAFAGLSLPERVKDINKELGRLEKLQKENEQTQEDEADLFGSLSTSNKKDDNDDFSFEDLLNESTKQTNESEDDSFLNEYLK